MRWLTECVSFYEAENSSQKERHGKMRDVQISLTEEFCTVMRYASSCAIMLVYLVVGVQLRCEGLPVLCVIVDPEVTLVA